MRRQNRSTRGKTSKSRVENQQTHSTYDAKCRNRTWTTLVEGKCSHHYANPATKICCVYWQLISVAVTSKTKFPLYVLFSRSNMILSYLGSLQWSYGISEVEDSCFTLFFRTSNRSCILARSVLRISWQCYKENDCMFVTLKSCHSLIIIKANLALIFLEGKLQIWCPVLLVQHS